MGEPGPGVKFRRPVGACENDKVAKGCEVLKEKIGKPHKNVMACLIAGKMNTVERATKGGAKIELSNDKKGMAYPTEEMFGTLVDTNKTSCPVLNVKFKID